MNDTILNTTISALSHEGRGIAHKEGKTTFIDGGLPGEELSYKIRKRHRQYDEAIAVEVLKSSPDRAKPQCQHYGICGGCSLQHLKPELQILHKQQALLELLERIGKVKPKEILAPLVGPHWGYRTKARLGVKYVLKKQQLFLGFREKDPRFLMDISQCEVLDPAVGHQLPAIKKLIEGLSIFQQIPQVEVAVSKQTVALIFRHMEALTENDKARLIDFAKAQNWHIYAQPQGLETIHRLWPTTGPDRLHYSLPAYQIEMQYHPIDFTQINNAINQQMIAQALELLQLSDEETALDLFCGIGNFTLPMSRFCRQVVGVEGASSSIARARENAAVNAIENVEFHTADLSKKVDHELWYRQRYDKVLIDPPRTGAIDVLSGVLEWQPSRLVYVSCNPATLARDAAKLQELGYTCQSAGVMDMFPQTSHVEAMALFLRTEP